MIVLPWLSFLIDLPSLFDWLSSQFGDQFVGIRGTSTLIIRMNDPATEEQVAAVKAHLATLTADGEAAKRALPSRRIGALEKHNDQMAFEAAVKSHIASKNLADLTVAEKKMMLGASLTNAEYDTLTTS